MAQWVLKANGNVVPRRSLRPLKVEELHSPTELKKQDVFDALIERRWGTSINPPKPARTREEDETFEYYQDEDESPKITPDTEEAVDATGRAINLQPSYDKIINAEVQLQTGDGPAVGVVRKRAVGPNGRTAGEYDDNPMLNSVVYEVEFPDGQVREYSANTIAMNMLTQVDTDGMSKTLMDGIVDYRKNENVAVGMNDKYITTRSGQRRLRVTTRGWELLIRWKDQTESWVRLAEMKESHPVETAEFAMARGIHKEPAFAWWVPYTLRKRTAILAAVKKRIRKTTHKYGIEVPKDVRHAFELDRQNGNTLWRDALQKEMVNVGVAFEILDEGKEAPKGWHKVTGHLIWDVKMDFT